MIQILFEDEWILVCLKPAGVLSEGNTPDCLPVLLAGQGEKEIYPVHRLDRNTCGVMVFARRRDAAAALCKSFSGEAGEKAAGKEYLAHIHGVPSPTEGEMRDLLYYDRMKNKVYPVSRMRRGVREARLSYSLIRKEPDGTSWIKIRLGTGRTHQIRVQFATRKMPLVGDRRYGSPAPESRFFLCAAELSFPHPHTGAPLVFRDTEHIEAVYAE